jgi:hypothetical protein
VALVAKKLLDLAFGGPFSAAFDAPRLPHVDEGLRLDPPPRCEKLLQQTGGLGGKHAPFDACVVIQTVYCEQVHHAPTRPRLRIVGAEYHPRDPRVQYRAYAHCARLECDVERAAAEPVIACVLRSIAQCGNFRMGGRIVTGNRPVVTAPDDLAVTYHDRADGHFAGSGRSGRERKGFAHESLISRFRNAGVSVLRLDEPVAPVANVAGLAHGGGLSIAAVRRV